MPTPEELQAKRDELAQLQKANADKQKERDLEAGEARRQAEYDRLEQEINFAKQSEQILSGLPPQGSANEVTPPDNTTVQAPPAPPSTPSSINLGNDNEKDGE